MFLEMLKFLFHSGGYIIWRCDTVLHLWDSSSDWVHPQSWLHSSWHQTRQPPPRQQRSCQVIRLWSLHRPQEVSQDRILPRPGEVRCSHGPAGQCQEESGELETQQTDAGILHGWDSWLHCSGSVCRCWVWQEVWLVVTRSYHVRDVGRISSIL